MFVIKSMFDSHALKMFSMNMYWERNRSSYVDGENTLDIKMIICGIKLRYFQFKTFLRFAQLITFLEFLN